VWTGQAVALKTTYAVTPGAVQWAGQTVNVLRITPVTAGAVAWQGQAVTVNVPATVTVLVAAGAVVWNGQTVTISQSGLNLGLPVLEPKAVLIGVEGFAFNVGQEGKAVLQEV
jgi:hypothetical protein